MTRREEMEQVLNELVPPHEGKGQDTISVSNVARTCFIKGWEAADAHPISPWISVEERLPDREETLTRFSKDVLCALDNGEFYITDYFDYERNRWNSFPDSITHWMPIPQIEKENKV